MRVVVQGREERDDWKDDNDNSRTTYRINARSVSMLPYRVEAVTLSAKPGSSEPEPSAEQTAP